MINKFLIAATVAVAGCSTPDAPVVRVPGTFTSLSVPIISDQWLAGKIQLAIKNKKGCGEFSNDLLPPTSENDFTMDIEGNQDFFFHIARFDAQIECNKTGIFYAGRGNQYVLNLDLKNKQCEISLIEKKPDGNTYKIKTYPAHASVVDGIKVCENKNKLY